MKAWGYMVLLAALGPGSAAAAAGGEGPVPAGWYVAPMATYMKPDSGRCGVNDGLGGSLILGNRGEHASLEVWGQYLSLPHDGCTYTVPDPADASMRVTVNEPPGDVQLNGGGIGVVLGPFFEEPFLARFFGVVGFGVLRRQDHPQYPQDDTTIFGDAGLGYFHPFQLWGLDVGLRGEMRYRYDVQQPPNPDDEDPPPPHAYGDLLFNLGLQLALSPRPEPVAVEPEPVAIVEVADTDGDGVPDDQDQCPGTPLGVAVDASGCEPPPVMPPAEPEEVTLDTARAGDTIVLHGVTFESNKAVLTSNARTILDQVAEKLAARPELRVEVGGHTDSRGSDAYNQRLSEQRANSVMDYLAGQGLEPGRLSAVGYGETQPVDSNDTDEGREANRRVELKVLE